MRDSVEYGSSLWKDLVVGGSGCRRGRVMLLAISALTASICHAQSASQIIGVVDGFNSAGSLVGWACSTGLNQSISVHVYVGGPAGSGTAVGAYSADQPSEPAVAAACSASGTNYRFSIPITAAIHQQHAGKAIYVHGISPVGGANLTIGNSGTYAIAAPLPSPPLFARTEVLTYHDNTAKWVLGQVASRTTDGVVAEQTSYDANTALPLQSRSFGKLKQTLTYNADGTVATVKDGNNNVTTLSSWKRGIPQQISFADGKTQSAVVSDNGWITQVTDENGFATNYGYDAMGRLASTTYPTGDSTAWATTTQAFVQVAAAEYGIPAGHWRQTVTTGNGVKVSYFDALWRPLLLREYDAGNVAGTERFTGYEYDHEGRVVFASYPSAVSNPDKGVWTTYDALGRTRSVAQDSEQGLLTTTTSYLNDASGAYALVTVPGGGQTRTWYQMFDQPSYDAPVRITHPEGAVTTITRDVFGKPTSIARGNSENTVQATRSYTYNANQELCRVIEPETGAAIMGYDGAGNLSWSAGGLGAATTVCHETGLVTGVQNRRIARTYDVRNRLKTITFPDGNGNQNWTYTADGLPLSVTTLNTEGASQVDNSYVYNKRRLLTQETQNQPGELVSTFSYGYNANGHLSSLSYPSGTLVDYAPNALGQPSKAGTYATGVSYFPNGGVKQFNYGNVITHTLTQNARGLPQQSCDSYGACGAAAVLNDTYAYDANANVSKITDGRTGGRATRTMTYDGLDRLKTATSTMFGSSAYTYDVLENLTRVTVGATSNLAARDHYYCYDSKWQLTNVKTGGCTGASVIGLSYDLQGNLANRNGTTHTFDYGNRLRIAHYAGATVESYRYDVHGRRVRSWSSGGSLRSVYSNAGELLYQRNDRTGKATDYIMLNGDLVATIERPLAGGAATVTYQHTDALGSPVAVTNASRTVIESSEYEPFGRVGNRAARDGAGYTGHAEDAATGLTYMQQRYYDPQIGRFLSVDPVTAYSSPVGAFNRYWYANNNPYKFTDPDGRLACIGQVACEHTSHFYNGTPAWEAGNKSTASVLRRHRTPKSQEKLIRSVGGDVETLKLAQKTHKDFVGSIIGLVAGGGLGSVGKNGTTTLYRAVSEAEAVSIGATGRFSAGQNSLGGKWLAETVEHAKQWGDALNGPGLSKLMEVKLPKPIADKLMRLERLDGIGPARYGELNQLEQAAIRELP